MGITKFRQYERTNLSFEEVFDGEYEFPLKNHPASVLDIGANEGAFTAWALEEWPSSNVVAFEPIPESADIFRRNHNGNPRVKFSELAISTASQVTMFYGKENSGQASIFKNGEQLDKSVQVKSILPSDLPSCEFVKVDAEGSELDIIPRLNLSKTKAIVFEYHNWADAEKIIICLERAGFESVEHKAHAAHRGVLKYARGDAYIKPQLQPSKPIKVFIGVPSFFYIDPHFHRCLLMLYGWLASQPDVPESIHGEVGHSFGDSPNVGRSRNMMTRNFLESDCTDLLFIDSDIVFSIDHVKRILSHPEEVVGGMYFKKCQGKAEACLNTIRNPIVKANGLNQVAYLGTGFLRIKRIVFEKIIERWGDEIAYCPDGSRDIIEYNFWNLAMHTFDRSVIEPTPDRIAEIVAKYKISEQLAEKAIRTRWLSEDWWFCQRCNDLGFKVWADRRIALKHSGNILYPLQTQEAEIFGKQVIYGTPKGEPASADASPRIPTIAASA